MAPNPRVIKAFRATRALGISDEEVKPVLKKLLKVYDKSWELIEDDNYRTLVDAYFEYKEDKGGEGKRKAPFSCHGGERPIQKLHLVDEVDQVPTTMDNSSQMLYAEDNKTPPKTSQQEITEPSQTLVQDIKPVTSSDASHKMLSEVENISLFPCVAAKDRKSYPQKVSSTGHSGHYEKEIVKPRTKKGLSEASNGNHCIKFLSTEDQDMHSKDATSACNNTTTTCKGNIIIASSHLGEVKISLNCDYALGQPNFCIPNLDLQALTKDERDSFHFISDIAKGSEKVKISLIDEIGGEDLPKFNYTPHNIIYQSANVNISLARIADEGCCSDCSGDCLSLSLPCACAQETGGEFAYTPQGLLKEEFLTSCMSMKDDPQDHHFVYCQECPLEKSKRCKGHLVRKFIKECWRKCGCDMRCGNRIVQRGLTCKLQVFLTCDGKGWGLRTLEDLPKGTFVCEYAGEILTNTELDERNVHNSGNDRHTYPVTLDADWGSEGVLKDEEALCLDATCNGNVARFINHRCSDANLIDIPVEVETPDHHYYHLAFFTNRKVSAYEELSWDYGIDFDDHDHPIKAFRCCCGSSFCCDKKQKGKRKIESGSYNKRNV
ncbi:histone-lysine N-methyltransferase SUVR4-like [Gastrolobium bilobum]|uniref:histone-lysine N-methyltransferase SUVR4-like n=1 Tax=Gastrolobium bilobum TaxID=150636 RepID=UPI002AB1A040|nr:histone-lysine N-methyltransferase SUVR4-like [Gastrolobium bilobum]